MNELSAEQLIEPLIAATQANTIRWEEDPTGGYLVRVGATVLNVYFKHGTWGFRVLDPGNNVVDWINEKDGSAPLRQLERLASRQVRNVDAVLTNIIQQLKLPAEASH